MVCDEDQQLTAEALEAARIAVNKCPTRPTSGEFHGRGPNGRLPVVDVIDGEGYLLMTNQLLLICDKLETPIDNQPQVPKEKGTLGFPGICFFHAFVTNEMGLSVLFLYELVFILPGDVMHIEGGYAKK